MSRPAMSRGGQRPGEGRRLAIGAAVLLVAAGAVYGLIRLLPDGKPIEKVEPTKVALASEPALKPEPAPPVKQLTNEEPGVVIDQGRGATPPAAPTGPASDPTKPSPVDVTSPELQPVTPANDPAAAPATTPPPPPPAALPASTSTSAVYSLMDVGNRALAANNLLEARTKLSQAYLHRETTPSDREALRQKLTTINEDLLFSPKIYENDPLVEAYVVQGGDSLERIRKKRDLAVDWRLIQRVNRISNPNAIRVGQKLKLPRGPFHAVVTKSAYRVDIFSGSPDEPDSWLYIRSFAAGLGESNGTPVGQFVIKKGSKLVNPPWTNPRTGEHFLADDPKNPIGEHWLGWQGVGDSAAYTGFGFHGTIDPDSIGQQRSMGCVRMRTDDIALVYELLVEQISTVQVLP